MLEHLVEQRTDAMMDAQREVDRSRRLSDLGRLSASIAHEMRRPVAALKLSLYNIRRKRSNTAIDTHLDNCDEKVHEAEQLLSNVLNSSTLNAPEFEPADLAALLTACIEEALSFCSNDNTRIIPRLRPLEGVEVSLDPGQIREVVLNLLSNACEALSGEPGDVTVEGFADGETAGFRVIDTNEGMDQEQREHATEPFYTTKHRGFGLGLSIADEIVKLHEGSLEIESSPQTGTTVIVTLPRRRPEA
jgi:two-component system sensor histidine kinase PilS (NtrC family)